MDTYFLILDLIVTFVTLIVEVDEHKHRGVDYKCDEQRMYDIIAKLGLPCIFNYFLSSKIVSGRLS